MSKISLEAIQAKILEQASRRGGLWPENAIFRQIVSEVGELSDAMNKDELIKPLKSGEEIPDIELEIADIFYALTCLALQRGVNLSDAILKKIRINEERDEERFKDKAQSQYGSGKDGNPHGDE
jgi:NTP pyrophosphatase (non-canonical NTP hydrolase)